LEGGERQRRKDNVLGRKGARKSTGSFIDGRSPHKREPGGEKKKVGRVSEKAYGFGEERGI